MDHTIEKIKDSFETLMNVQGLFYENEDAIDYCERKQQDLLHEIELNTFNAADGFMLAKNLKETRQQRRRCKDQNKLLKPAMDFFKKNPKVIPYMTEVLDKMSQREECIQNREYQPRATTAMQVAFEKAKIG